MIKTKLLVSALAIVGMMLLATAEVKAQFTVFQPLSFSRTCANLPIAKTGTVTIQAGPDGIGGLAAQFPKQTACPDGVGTCLEWEYQWTYNGANPSHTLLSAPSDVEIIVTPDGSPSVSTPPAQDSTFKVGQNIFDVRLIRHNANGTTFQASYFTRKTGVAIGLITAAASSGSTTAFCAIAGATSSGESTDFFAPLAAAECKVSGNNSFSILRGKDSCVQELRAFENPNCAGTGTLIPGEALESNILSTGPLVGNYLCAETLTVTANSPCQLYKTTSGGTTYKWCYHADSLIGTSNCINHTGICATHP
jgi:hypothetical protein